jgi:hypothetical protein
MREVRSAALPVSRPLAALAADCREKVKFASAANLTGGWRRKEHYCSSEICLSSGAS